MTQVTSQIILMRAFHPELIYSREILVSPHALSPSVPSNPTNTSCMVTIDWGKSKLWPLKEEITGQRRPSLTLVLVIDMGINHACQVTPNTLEFSESSINRGPLLFMVRTTHLSS